MTPDTGWQAFLSDGERMLWSGRPAGDIAISDFLTARLPFGLVFTAFALFWIAVASWMGQGTDEFGVFALFPLFGIPFVLVGLHLMIGMPLWDAYERSRSWYALSDQAAYIAVELFGKRRLKRYPISDMNALELEDGPVGTVWFNRDVQLHRTTRRRRRHAGSMHHTYTTTTRKGFKRIAGARTVYGLIVRQLNRQDKATAD